MALSRELGGDGVLLYHLNVVVMAMACFSM
jgi:hypothetical protein